MDDIILKYISRGGDQNIAVQKNIRKFLESSDGQYYLDAKERYLLGNLTDAEFNKWRQKLQYVCPNFSRLEGLSVGTIPSSFPFLSELTSSAGAAFSGIGFPWYQMLTNYGDDYRASIISGQPILTQDEIINAGAAFGNPPYQQTTAEEGSVYLYSRDCVFSLKKHTWNVMVFEYSLMHLIY